MSVYALSAIRREERRLNLVAQRLATCESVPASVAAQVRTAAEELADAGQALAFLLDRDGGSV